LRYFYDCEFLEDGRTIGLISIGIEAEDGRAFYGIVEDRSLWRRVRKHPWLMANVVPHLPRASGDARNQQPASWLFNYADPAVMNRWSLAARVQEFIEAGGPDREQHELWAYFGAYDHVALCQLWGRMIDLPACVPMWTHELMQLPEVGAAIRQVPQQQEHHALADARWNRDVYLKWEEINGG